MVVVRSYELVKFYIMIQWHEHAIKHDIQIIDRLNLLSVSFPNTRIQEVVKLLLYQHTICTCACILFICDLICENRT